MTQDYNTGLLGGDNTWTVEQWHDYLRAEIAAANDHWREEHRYAPPARCPTEQEQMPQDDPPCCRCGEPAHCTTRLGDDCYDGFGAGPYCDECYAKLCPELHENVEALLAEVATLSRQLRAEKRDHRQLQLYPPGSERLDNMRDRDGW